MESEYCDAPYGPHRCFREKGHSGVHASSVNAKWDDGDEFECECSAAKELAERKANDAQLSLPDPRDSELARLRDANMRLAKIVMAFASHAPLVGLHCIYCGAMRVADPEPHADSCPWLAARKECGL